MSLQSVLPAGGAEAAAEAPRTNRRSGQQNPPLAPRPELMHAEAPNELVATLLSYQSNGGSESEGPMLIRRAYAVAREAHEGQTRRSGEDYILHPVEVAKILLGLHLDAASVAAALLHDVVEDTSVTKDQIEGLFGKEIARLVDGVTKLTTLENQSKEDAQAGTYRKMFVAMADDPRVVLVKLADRLHNMRTIHYMKPESQRRIARETMDIYAPLAHRLGIWQIKWELEDRSFAVLNPEKFQEITRQLAQRREGRERVIARVIQRLRHLLDKEGIKAEITGRPKHIYSIYRKMERKGVSLDQIYDQLAVRVIVGDSEGTPRAEGSERADEASKTAEPERRADPNVGECYRVLGLVHTTWPPVPGEFDDYIANPKESMYQSLHTTVLIPGGQPCEIQIRSREMHSVAEYGIAAHWHYKEGFGRQDPSFEAKLKWLRSLIGWQSDVTSNSEFVESVKSDVLDEQVYVFTPKGKIIDLPLGSTPVDFAYRIHSEVGHRCVGAKVNNRMVPLDHQLKNGDIVHIMTSKAERGPSRDWLNFVRTSGARNHIRRYLKRERREENEAAGRDMLEKELKKLGLSVPFDEVAHAWNLKTAEDLFAHIGSGDLTARQVVQKILSQHVKEEDALASIPQVTPQPERRTDPKGIQVRGVDGLLTRLARCCNPVVGEPIVGFVTRGKGVTVHRADCRTIVNERDRARLVEVTWGGHSPQGYPVPVWIESWDRVGLWRDISSLVADANINIAEVKQVPTRKPGRAILLVTLTIQSISQLTMILDKLNRMPDVIEARRDSDGVAASA